MHLCRRGVLEQGETLDDELLVGIKGTTAIAYAFGVLLKLAGVHVEKLFYCSKIYSLMSGDPTQRFVLLVIELVTVSCIM